MVGKTLLHYTIESELGHGGMGVVYRATDTKLDRKVAIKFLGADLTADDVAKERFIREAKAAASVEHESICAIFEIGETGEGQTFIVMPLYEGKTLKELIFEGPLDPVKVMDLSMQIGSGLAAAHAKGIVHRDIKPANVLVTKRGRAKILDFGLAKLAGQLDLTKSRSSIGTVPYMAPEQVRGDAMDERTDIWALGAVMYEMLSGQRPFRGEYEQAVTYSILNVDPEPLDTLRKGLPEGLSDVVQRCLSKHPDLRYQSVSSLLQDVELPSGVRPFSGSYTRVVQEKRGRSWAIRVVGGVLLAAAVWIGYAVFSDSPGQGGLSERHLAILPFPVIGDLEDGEALASGLLETLTSSLTRLERSNEKLWVVPATEIESSMSISDVHRQLGANLVVTGSIQSDGERIRIVLTLNDASTLRAIDSDQYDDVGSGTFALQDEAVRRLSRMLQLDVKEEDTAAIAATQSTARTANDAYLKAVGYLRNQQSVEDLDVAIGLLRLAVSDDSLFALAYAGLGSAYWSKYSRTQDNRWVDDAISFSQKALELNPGLAEVHITLGRINSGRGDAGAALDAYNRALEIDPSSAEAYRLRSVPLRALGRTNEAEASLLRAVELAPDFWRVYNSLASHYYNLGRLEETLVVARQGLEKAPDNVVLLNLMGAATWKLERVADAVGQFEKIIAIDPDYRATRSNLATAYFYTGRYPEAADLYAEVIRRNPNVYSYRGYLADALYWSKRERHEIEDAYQDAIDAARQTLKINPTDAEVIGSMAGYFAHLGQSDSAAVYLERSIALVPVGSMTGESAFGIGETYLHLGQQDRAETWIEQALSQNAGWMQLHFSPWLAPIREDVDFVNRMSVYRSD